MTVCFNEMKKHHGSTSEGSRRLWGVGGGGVGGGIYHHMGGLNSIYAAIRSKREYKLS